MATSKSLEWGTVSRGNCWGKENGTLSYGDGTLKRQRWSAVSRGRQVAGRGPPCDACYIKLKTGRGATHLALDHGNMKEKEKNGRKDSPSRGNGQRPDYDGPWTVSGGCGRSETTTKG